MARENGCKRVAYVTPPPGMDREHGVRVGSWIRCWKERTAPSHRARSLHLRLLLCCSPGTIRPRRSRCSRTLLLLLRLRQGRTTTGTMGHGRPGQTLSKPIDTRWFAPRPALQARCPEARCEVQSGHVRLPTTYCCSLLCDLRHNAV